MKNQSQKETMQLIEYLISNGYLLTINGEYPVLKVTERGIQVLKGQESVYRKEPKKVSSYRMKKPIHYLKCCGTANGSSIRSRRSPYVVFSDSTLKEMSRIRPSSRLEMLQIKELAKASDKYGETFYLG